ncbi:G3ST3 sulfotransferase, partial [Amia calva]|nr:G3ST3 sulfotransferase [Amia calva]
HHHIVFLKTHKTGGSTVQNLLFRLAEKEGLTFAFPYFTYQFGYPQRFREEFVDELPPGASQFDILCSHMRLDLPQLRRMMPADSIYLTILRDPVSTFESVFSYYASMVPAFTLVQNRASDSPGGPDQRQLLAAFLASPESYYDPADPSNGLARNPMTFDLGLGPREWNASWAGELAKLAEAFHLVMIAKHFDESLVLLKELLQLDYQDLVYVELNARPGPDRAQPDEELRARVRSWNALDVLLYEHFSRLFWEKARRYGLRRLAEGVRELRALARRTRRRCLQREGVPPGELEDLLRPWQPNSATILGYDLRGNLSAQEQGSCLRLVLPELQYHSYLYFQQYGR